MQADCFAVFAKVCFCSFIFFVVGCSVNEQNHVRVFAREDIHVLEEVLAVSCRVLAEQLSSVVCECSVPHGVFVRACCEDYRLASFARPNLSDFCFVNKDAFINSNNYPRFADACQVGRVFFKNAFLALSLECA